MRHGIPVYNKQRFFPKHKLMFVTEVRCIFLEVGTGIQTPGNTKRAALCYE